MKLVDVTKKQTKHLSDCDDLIAAALVFASIADDTGERAGDRIKATAEWRLALQDVYRRMVEQNLAENAWANQTLKSA